MSEIIVQQYKPSEVIAIFNEILSRQNIQTGGKLVCIRGIYVANRVNPQWAYCYDTLRDETNQDELTIRISNIQRQELTNGNLVDILGTFSRQINNKGQIQLVLNVSRLNIVQNQVLNEVEMKHIELRQQKVMKGFKNVDAILEELLYKDERPRVALIFAASSITLSDFEAGINAAKATIDFKEYRVSFANTVDLCKCLRSVDLANYSAIALVRGGDKGIDKLDDPTVLKTVISLNTPFISAVSHADVKLFIKQVADKVISTPNGLGQYFSELVESVTEKKNKSHAVLMERIHKQYQHQLEDRKKQNKELQDQLSKQNETLIKLQEQQKKQQEDSNKQIYELNVTIRKIHESNDIKIAEKAKALETAVGKMTELDKQLNDTKRIEKRYKIFIVVLCLLVIAMVFIICHISKYAYLL